MLRYGSEANLAVLQKGRTDDKWGRVYQIRGGEVTGFDDVANGPFGHVGVFGF